MLLAALCLAGTAHADTDPSGPTGPWPLRSNESLPEAPPELAQRQECLPTWPLVEEEYVGAVTAGFRQLSSRAPTSRGLVDEVHNARVIWQTFRDQGFSTAVAMAAIVNAFEESELNNKNVMSTPFFYRSRYYPRGTRAVGLFQLLPMRVGAGGPSGRAEGYPYDFMGRRWAGTRWQANRHGIVPDNRGRTYYDATNPRINTERIVLEVRRDGARLLAADARGASIADLSVIFGRDIERPAGPVWQRRQRAAAMLGKEIAYARHPELLFPDPVLPEPERPPAEQCPQDTPAEEPVVMAHASTVGVGGWFLLSFLGIWGVRVSS